MIISSELRLIIKRETTSVYNFILLPTPASVLYPMKMLFYTVTNYRSGVDELTLIFRGVIIKHVIRKINAKLSFLCAAGFA